MIALKYLFTAFYLDGTSFQQPAEDRSVIDPSKSAFFDVDTTRLVSFQLTGAGRLAGVNLLNGDIFLDGKVTSPFGSFSGVFTLVYFRRHTVVMVVGGGKPDQEQSHKIEYHFGWTHPVLGTQEVVLC